VREVVEVVVAVAVLSGMSVVVTDELCGIPDVAVEGSAVDTNDDSMLLNVSPLGSFFHTGPAIFGE
jgi:hypothetical protein